MTIKQLLVYASQVKLNGYVSVPMNYYMGAIEMLHYKKGVSLLGRESQKYIFEKNGVSGIYIQAFLPNIGVSKNTLVTSESSDILKSIYLKGQLSASYEELAFQLFLMGLIEPHDYLKHNTSLDFIFSRIDAKTRFSSYKNTSSILNKIELSYARYRNLMSVYIENICSGTDYGYPVWDFVYSFSDLILYRPIHLWKTNHYISIIKSICALDIQDYSVFALTDDIVNKYYTEISLLFPLIVDWLIERYGKKKIYNLFIFLLDKADNYLYQALLSDEWVLDAINSEGVEIR